MIELPVVVWLPAALGLAIVAGAVSLFLGRRSERNRAEAEGRSGAQLAERHLAEARRAAETERTQLILTGKEELIRAREAWEQETSGRREEIGRVERRLDERTGLVDRKLEILKAAVHPDQHVEVRESAIEALVSLGDLQALAVLQPLLADKRREIREVASAAIIEVQELANKPVQSNPQP